MKHKKCVVVHEKLSENDIDNIRHAQKNTSERSDRKGEESAFSKALEGSKIYLEEQGLTEK